MTQLSSERLHATAVAIGDWAVLIEGPSGAGKSDLALRLIDRGARLIADDQTLLAVRDGALLAFPPPSIAGRIEVRGIGIVDRPHVGDAPVALAVVLVDHPERMPDATQRPLLGVAVPLVALNAFEASAPIKVELALRRVLAAAA